MDPLHPVAPPPPPVLSLMTWTVTRTGGLHDVLAPIARGLACSLLWLVGEHGIEPCEDDYADEAGLVTHHHGHDHPHFFEVLAASLLGLCGMAALACIAFWFAAVLCPTQRKRPLAYQSLRDIVSEAAPCTPIATTATTRTAATSATRTTGGATAVTAVTATPAWSLRHLLVNTAAPSVVAAAPPVLAPGIALAAARSSSPSDACATDLAGRPPGAPTSTASGGVDNTTKQPTGGANSGTARARSREVAQETATVEATAAATGDAVGGIAAAPAAVLDQAADGKAAAAQAAEALHAAFLATVPTLPSVPASRAERIAARSSCLGPSHELAPGCASSAAHPHGAASGAPEQAASDMIAIPTSARSARELARARQDARNGAAGRMAHNDHGMGTSPSTTHASHRAMTRPASARDPTAPRWTAASARRLSAPSRGMAWSREDLQVPFPFRKSYLDEWSAELRTFGEMGGPPRTRRPSAGQPGSSPVKTTIFLGNGYQFDRAEAARVATVERSGTPLLSAYPRAHGQDELEVRQVFFEGASRSASRSGRSRSSSSPGEQQRRTAGSGTVPLPPVVNLTLGGL